MTARSNVKSKKTRSAPKKKTAKKKAVKKAPKRKTTKKPAKRRRSVKVGGLPDPAWEVVTPEMAEAYLATNTENRRIRKKTVAFYAQQMKDGEWEENAESIKFRKNKVLLDGQHRLLACIESGVPFRTLVARGLGDVFDSIDALTPRGPSDALQRHGYKGYSSKLSAAARIIDAIENIEDGDSGSSLNLGRKRSNKDVVRTVRQYEDHLLEGCKLIEKGEGRTILRPGSVFVACYAIFAHKNKTRALDFMEALTSGEMLAANDPVKRLRSLLMSALSEPNVRRKKQWLIAVTIKSWNAFLQGETIGQLRFSETENWPKIRARK